MVGLPPRFAIPTDVLESYPALALQGVSEFTGVVAIDPLVQRPIMRSKVSNRLVRLTRFSSS
jgi:hypothetical protein